MMNIVAKHANGWNMMGISTVEGYRKGKKLLRQLCNTLGRNVNEIKTSIGIKSSLEELGQKLECFQKEGLDLAILRLPKAKEIEYLQQIKWE